MRLVPACPRAGGQGPERLVPDPGLGIRRSDLAERRRWVRPPHESRAVLLDPRQMATVEGEGRLWHHALGVLGGHQRDGLGATVREQQPVGRHADRPSQLGGRALGIRVVANNHHRAFARW